MNKKTIILMTIFILALLQMANAQTVEYYMCKWYIGNDNYAPGIVGMTGNEFCSQAQVGKDSCGIEYRAAARYKDSKCNEWYVHGGVKPVKSAKLRLKRTTGENKTTGKYIVNVKKLLLKFGNNPQNFDNHTATEMFAAANGTEMFSFDLVNKDEEYVIDPMDLSVFKPIKPGFLNYLNDSLSFNFEITPWDDYMTYWIGLGFTSACPEVFDIESTSFLASGNNSNGGEVNGTLLTLNPSSYTIGASAEKFEPLIKTQKRINNSWVNTNVEYFVSTKSNWINIGSKHGYTVGGVANLNFDVNDLTGRNRTGYVYVETLFPQGGGIYISNTDSIKITQNYKQIISPRETAALLTNSPNPFNPTTAISYNLNNPCNIKLSVYDVTGRQIATLVNGNRAAGLHSVSFDGSKVASGIYYYTLEANGEIVGKKSMLLVK